ncbi:MAG: hypothetical protein KGN39_03435 [Betaproteobacteria bacterium]|nr:hypothetical protein [Betaproteobacteria bacterium]
MKIHQLALGDRFEYQGESYVKTAPMMARSDAGVQRLIPRYAVLTPLAEAGIATADSQGLRQAFDVFYGICAGLVPAESLAELEAARNSFLERLK